MTENTRNTYASHGLEILKRVVLEVLYEETDVSPVKQVFLYGHGRLLEAHKIREQLRLPQPRYAPISPALIHGVLGYLKDNGYAEHYGRQGWQITNKGVSLIEG